MGQDRPAARETIERPVCERAEFKIEILSALSGRELGARAVMAATQHLGRRPQLIGFRLDNLFGDDFGHGDSGSGPCAVLSNQFAPLTSDLSWPRSVGAWVKMDLTASISTLIARFDR